MATRGRGAGLDVLVTGGCGYIGSFIVRHLLDAGHRPVVLRQPLLRPSLGGAGGAAGRGRPRRPRAGSRPLLAERRFAAVIHCAAHIWVGELVREPARYYANNTGNAIQLFDLCAQARRPAVVFSSTAAVYGQPDVALIDESLPLAPINPYGASKMMAERVLADIAAATGLRYAILRYFNVAGADARGADRRGHARQRASDQGRLRDRHRPAPGAWRSTAPTTRRRTAPASATMSMSTTSPAPTSPALEHLVDGGASLVANCGYGHGFSVREVLDTARRVTGVAVPDRGGPAPAGRPAGPGRRQPPHPHGARLDAAARRPRLHRRHRLALGAAAAADPRRADARPLTAQLRSAAAALAHLLIGLGPASAPASAQAQPLRPAWRDPRAPVLPGGTAAIPQPAGADARGPDRRRSRTTRRAPSCWPGCKALYRPAARRRRPSRTIGDALEQLQRGRRPSGSQNAVRGAGRAGAPRSQECRCCCLAVEPAHRADQPGVWWYVLGSQIGRRSSLGFAASLVVRLPAARLARAAATCPWRPRESKADSRRRWPISLVNLLALLAFLARHLRRARLHASSILARAVAGDILIAAAIARVVTAAEQGATSRPRTRARRLCRHGRRRRARGASAGWRRCSAWRSTATSGSRRRAGSACPGPCTRFLLHLLFLVVAVLAISAIYRAARPSWRPLIERWGAASAAPGCARYLPWRAFSTVGHHVLAAWVALVYLVWALRHPAAAAPADPRRARSRSWR